MEHVRTGAHHVLPRGDQTVTFHGVWSNDRTVVDHPTGEVRGQECTLVFTLRVDRHRLDGDVARLGFRGSHNGDIFTLDVPASMEYRTGLWDLLFPIRWVSAVSGPSSVEAGGPGQPATAPKEERHSYAGAFYAETVHGTYYWLKYRGESDFRFDYTSLPTLATLAPTDR